MLQNSTWGMLHDGVSAGKLLQGKHAAQAANTLCFQMDCLFLLDICEWLHKDLMLMLEGIFGS